MRRLLVAAAVLLVLSFPSALRAQITDVTDDTIAPIPGAGHDYIHLLSETVNPANGSVSVNIGLPAPKGRGISLPFAITYNSGAAGHFTAGGGFIASQAPFTGGWGNSLPNLTLAYQSINFPYGDGQPGSPTETCYFTTGYMFTDIFGGSHALGLAAASLEPFSGGNCTQMGSNIPSFNPVNSGGDSQVRSIFTALCGQLGGNGPPPNTGCSYATPPLLVFDKAGTIYSFAPYGQLVMGWTGGYTVWPVSMEDRNGNIITFNMTRGGALTVTDTAGRPLVSLNGSNTNGYIPTVVSVGGLTYSLAYTTANIGYTPQVEGLAPPDGVTNPPGLNCNQSSSGSATPKVVSSITLPNNQTYQFTYNPTYGTLSKIQYPDGGWVKYTWKLSDTYSENDLYSGIPESGPPLSLSCNFLYKTPVVATREVGFTTSTTPVLTQAFTYNTNWNQTLSQNYQWTSKSTTVQTTDNVRNLVSKTVYTYSPVGAGPSGEPGFAGSPVIAGELAVEQQVQYYDWGPSAPGALIQTVSKSWFDQFNLQYQQTALNTASPAPTSEVDYQYGFGGAITQKQEYDFGSGARGTLLRTTVNNYQTFAGNPLYTVDSQAPSPTLLTFPCQTIVYSGGTNGTRVAETDYLYDGGTSTCGTTGTPSVTGVTGLPTGTHDETYYGPSSTTPAPRGNVTTITQQCFPGCAAPSTTYTYDETGQVLSVKSPLHAITQYAYTDSYSPCGGAAPPSGNTNAYLTEITDPLGHTQKYCYGYTDGLLRGSTDANNQTASYAYSDPLLRLTSSSYPDGGGTTVTYNDSVPSVSTSKKITSSQSSTATGIMDGMGHVIQTQLTSDPSGTDYTDTTYNGVGLVNTVSNPYRTGGTVITSTEGTTRYQYDALNRTTLVTEPDNSTVMTSYNGNATTVTDEAGKTRESFVDGLGRMEEVIENPSGLNWATNYTFDALDDLIGVVQGGSHTRTFVYDSLKRLTSSLNPETGTTPVKYSYDADSRVSTKTDARGITITYSWDTVNRMLGRTYSNGDPSVGYVYDQTTCVVVTTCYNIGRMTSMTDAAGSESFAYDKMDRLWGDQRTTNSITKNASYIYNLDGSLATLTYPSGRTITYAYNAAAQPTNATDVANGISYASDGFYAPHGGRMFVASGVAYTTIYNSRLQPCWSWAGAGTTLPDTYACTATATAGTILDLKYNFNLGADNGNLVGITNDRNGNRSQVYGYDQVNRITSAATVSTCTASCWSLTFGLDQWANLKTATATGTATPLTLNVSTSNQITTAPFTYDASGNETADTTSTYAWNAESEMKMGGGVNYLYDGRGNRVEKSGTKLYWYGIGGEVLDETDTTGSFSDAAFNEYIYFGGERIARRDYQSNVFFYYADQVGSSRSIAESVNGTLVLCYDADFYPYGGEDVFTNTCPQNYKFDGKERDTETGNDYFGARFYSSTYGRFLSADWSSTPSPVPYANLSNPQTLNLYAFVHDNPESFADLDGHGCLVVGTGVICGLGEGDAFASNVERWNDGLPPQSQAQYNAEIRAKIAKTAEQYLTSTDWAYGKQKGKAPCNTWKCNIFVGDVTREAGASAKIHGRYPLAGEWADKNTKIDNWRVLGADEKPEPGDVAAYKIPGCQGCTGHSGIVVGIDSEGVHVIAAHRDVVGPDDKFQPTNPAVVYRRYTGDE